MSFIDDVREKQARAKADEPEVNLTPVMNMFLILIPFLVSMAVFAHVAVIEVNLPSDAGMSKGQSRKELKLTVAVSQTGFSLALGDTLLDTIPLLDKSALNYTVLQQTLAEQRAIIENKNDLTVAVSDGIIFDKVVATMDAGRFAGFSKISLSSAPAQQGAP
ncbi:MAG: hypothetical protein A2268_08470 [Candidatus Raymondbacteria bacterium RifOxyA12_full_50_37]|uniref:Biopolymer transporter ExbD n=1 Tax=Candidatus Raymondbacteria bacterium RIFOXYD12_FULL_49_13 TaxID=1817890 RepID=A0A1F7F3X2_UNCRA|nr:MAG: hypothetical protein A2268_08470 [Candidatus Raymondbacteria bacterium RifOxyA12_full_50_37]OGJ90367.1 MAG: hypothetical protein A2248_17405 [Candidatus Raymondbacteria bacterium RIFOXYA2_FULL_49_16]OGK01298.1 MAG: hypothetical protein A2519_12910 [Candidatus Raymondbacteria bacterium RIFOXYD12_FULL_49_13]OGP43266.1 MAG: hypothetical protein A2324_08235 [Candidatus Raymondbacteria bacterium RIFOXYB2_FULL_49_35]